MSVENKAKIIKGEKRKLTVRLTQANGEPYDLTGHTLIEAKFKSTGANPIVKTDTDGITVVSDILGKVEITLEIADTNALKEGDKESFDVIITKPSEKRIAIFDRVLEIKKPTV